MTLPTAIQWAMTLTIVAAAAAWAISRWMRRRRGKCGSTPPHDKACSDCPLKKNCEKFS